MTIAVVPAADPAAGGDPSNQVRKARGTRVPLFRQGFFFQVGDEIG